MTLQVPSRLYLETSFAVYLAGTQGQKSQTFVSAKFFDWALSSTLSYLLYSRQQHIQDIREPNSDLVDWFEQSFIVDNYLLSFHLADKAKISNIHQRSTVGMFLLSLNIYNPRPDHEGACLSIQRAR